MAKLLEIMGETETKILCQATVRRTWVPAVPLVISPLTPNNHYRGRTAPVTSKRCILYIYSTNIGTAYFKHDIYSPLFLVKCGLFHNSNEIGSCVIYILCTECAKILVRSIEELLE